MKELRFDYLYAPEFYHEIPDYDSRIAIRKFLDARDTMGMAKFSLSYIDTVQVDDFEKNFVKTIHLRHAIVDLNNSFDLLLQIPWLYYRAWKAFNNDGALRSKDYSNFNEIVRNDADWVYCAEREYSLQKLLKYLNSTQNPLKMKIENFKKKYINNNSKHFTIRTLCNIMKHNHILSFEELYEPYDFNVTINGISRNLRQNNLGIRFEQNFYDKSHPDEILGVIKTSYERDLSIDISYSGSDEFRSSDSIHANRYKIMEVLKECIDYFDATVDLFEDIYGEIYPKLIPCLSLTNGQEPNINKGINNINLNKYFTVI